MRLIKKIFLLILALGGLAYVSFKIIFYFWAYDEIKNDSYDSVKAAFLENKANSLKEEGNLDKTDSLNETNLCNNSYLPIIPGASWNYVISVSDPKNNGNESNEYINKEDLVWYIWEPIKDIDKKSADDKDDQNRELRLESGLNDNEWNFVSGINCNHNGTAIDNLNLFLPTAKKFITTTPLSQKGFFLPSDFNNRSVWQYELVTKNESDAEMLSVFEEKIKINFKLVANEQIESPAGQVEAKKVQADWEIERIFPKGDLSADHKPEEKNIQASARHFFWLVDGIGIIKSVYQEKDNSSITLTLKGFQIPADKLAPKE